ncbi:ATP-binding protein [Acinetobacter modestus]|uniref:ATP-binding protein n=1 Tax=Acinetobacter modestus TaxID=1776740 RepID=UPI0032085C27
MELVTFKGAAEITDAGIKKHFRNFEPWQAIFELVWNGFDAKAESVEIRVYENDMGGIASVAILDDGHGVDFKNTADNFQKFNESSKKGDFGLHGLHGRGRLAFHLLCNQATWFTRHESSDARIVINSTNIKNFSGTQLEQKDQHILLATKHCGTCVELADFTGTIPQDKDFSIKLAIEFGWFLALNEKKSLYLNGIKITTPSHDIYSNNISIKGYEFLIRVIRWHNKPSSEKSYNYFLNEEGKIIYKEYSSFNKKPNFYVSTYISSEWNNNFEPFEEDLATSHEFTKSSPIWKQLCSQVNIYIQQAYDDFLRKYVEDQLDKFEAEGAFPEYKSEDKEYVKWRKKNITDLVRSIYFLEPTIFSNLKKKQRKIIIRLLDKLTISNENDSLLEILESVLELDATSLESFASQIQKTKLENIISTIEILQKRECVIRQLKEIMDVHYKDVLETPDLQKIIENHTWLFGGAYEILGAEEDSFTSITRNLRNNIKEIHDITEIDVDEPANVLGAQRQVDLFLARKVPTWDSEGKQYYKCVIIEIKRPGISLNQKHLRQLDEYASILSNFPEFKSDLVKFELILVGRKISDNDYTIRSRLSSSKHHGESGLVTNDGKIKSYVKNWYTIFDEFFLSNEYLLDRLKTSREELSLFSTQELVMNLQAESKLPE